MDWAGTVIAVIDTGAMSMTKTAMIECPSCAGNGGMGVYCEECECTGQVSVPANVAEHLAWLEKQAAALAAMTARAERVEAKLANMTLYASYCAQLIDESYMEFGEWMAKPHCPVCGSDAIYTMDDGSETWCGMGCGYLVWHDDPQEVQP